MLFDNFCKLFYELHRNTSNLGYHADSSNAGRYFHRFTFRTGLDRLVCRDHDLIVEVVPNIEHIIPKESWNREHDALQSATVIVKNFNTGVVIHESVIEFGAHKHEECFDFDKATAVFDIFSLMHKINKIICSYL